MRLLLAPSLAIALAALFYPFFSVLLFLTQEWTQRPTCLFLAICWLVLFAVGLFKFRSRGLWLLIGLPFAAYWPFAFFMTPGHVPTI